MWCLRRLFLAIACLDFLIETSGPAGIFADIAKNPKLLSRRKRYLIFPEGSNIQALIFEESGLLAENCPTQIQQTTMYDWPRLERFSEVLYRLVLTDSGDSGALSGSSDLFQLVYCLTIGAYGRQDDLVLGLTAALAWELPTNPDTKLSSLLHRRSRSVMFPKMEAFLQSLGLDGRSCVLRALCEAGQRDPSEIAKGTFLQELLHAIFTLPSDTRSFEKVEDRAYERAHRAKDNCQQLYEGCPYSIYDLDL